MKRILVIEDDAAMRRMLHRILADAGYDVQEAADGTAGLTAYRQQRSDLVIADIVMPNTEGLETIRALRRHDATVNIIAISGADRGRADNYLDLAVKFGACRALVKPFSQDEFLTAVSDVLGSR
jgi:DNA-binding response OmpR family regulator